MTCGIPANPVTGKALAEADLIILFGSRFGFTFEAQYAPPTTKIVRVDVEPSAFSNGREAEVGIVGDAGVRAVAMQPKMYVGMVLILIFAEALGLYGLIVGLIMTSHESTSCGFGSPLR